MKGLGAVFLQEGKPVIYVSRTLFQHREGIARSGVRHEESSQLCVW